LRFGLVDADRLKEVLVDVQLEPINREATEKLNREIIWKIKNKM
jgi:hypothetical protein